MKMSVMHIMQVTLSTGVFLTATTVLASGTSSAGACHAAHRGASINQGRSANQIVPSTLVHFNTDQFPFENLKREMRFNTFRKNELRHPRKGYFDPSAYDISEIRVSRAGDILLKPNIENGVRTDFGMLPLLARLMPDGQFAEARPMFTNPKHPLREFPIESYDYQLDFNLQTLVGRAVLFLKPGPKYHLVSGDPTVPPEHMGQADAFFVGPKRNELPSLSQATGLKFNNITELSETLYFAETTKNDFAVIYYNPSMSQAKILARISNTMTDPDFLGMFFRNQYNRDRVSLKWVGEQHLYIVGQGHVLGIDLGRDGYGAKLLSVDPLYNRNGYSHPSTKDPGVPNNTYSVKVVPTTAGQSVEEFNIQVKENSSYSWEKHLFSKSSTVSQVDNAGNSIQSWNIPGLRIGSKFFRVKGGFVVQKSAFIEARDLHYEKDTEVGIDHRIFFLGDNGEVKVVSHQYYQDLGDLAIVDGRAFFVSRSGDQLYFLDVPDWR